MHVCCPEGFQEEDEEACGFSGGVGEHPGSGTGAGMGMRGLWEPASAVGFCCSDCRAALWRGESRGGCPTGRAPVLGRAAGGGAEQRGPGAAGGCVSDWDGTARPPEV